MRITVVFLTALVFLVGCGSEQKIVVESLIAQTSTPSGKYLFAVVYENHAWETTKKGLVIQGNGDIYKFDASTTPAGLPESDTSSETELTRFFEAAQFEFVTNIQTSQFDYYRDLAQTLSNKTLADASTACRDAGVYKYLVFQAIDLSNYRSTLIYQTGDIRRVQSDIKAEALKDFLITQAVLHGIVMKSDDEKENWCVGY